MAQRFDMKNPSESFSLTFDLSAGLSTGETLSGNPTSTISVLSGVDANASTVLVGSPTLNSGSTQVLVAVTGGLDGVDYEIKAVSATTNVNKTLALVGILPVRN